MCGSSNRLAAYSKSRFLVSDAISRVSKKLILVHMSNRRTFSDAETYIRTIKIDNNIHYDSVVFGEAMTYFPILFSFVVRREFFIFNKTNSPGGITAVSPGPPSISEPSSILTFILPEIIYDVCGAWQLFVPTSSLTHFSQLHPGSNVALPTTTSPKFASSIFPFSNVRVSSGEESKLFSAYWPTVFVKNILLLLC
jgi:hypothetical protein